MNKKRLLTNFFRLVRIDSPSGYEDDITNWLCGLFVREKLVDYTTIDNYGNLYARVNGEGKPYFFAAHVDTVEPGRSIQPVRVGNYITSKGETILGADNKSSLACILEYLFVRKKNSEGHRALELIFTRSEEVGNYGAVNFNYSLLKARKGFCFDLSEPIGTIATASPFYERFDLVLIGKSVHASRPQDGINPLNYLGRLLQTVTIGRLDAETILNIGVIQGGFVRNAVPGTITLKGEIRSYSEKRLLAHKKRFINQIKKALRNEQKRYKIAFARENGGYTHKTREAKQFISETEKKILAVKQSFRKVKTWGVSDANIFNEKGRLCLNLGDGSEFSHSTRERVALSALYDLTTLLVELTKR